MSFARLHKLVAYLIAGLGLFALGLGDELGVVSKIVIFLAFAASFGAEGRILRDPRWTRGWTAALLVALAVQVLRGVAGGAILPLVLEFTAALQISRLFNRRGAREHREIAALALLHLIAATVLSTALSYAFAFLGFVIVAPWALALGHLRGEIEGQYTATDDPARGESDVARVLASRRVVGPRFLAGIALLSVPLFLMTALVFLLFPRVGIGFLTFGRERAQRVTGFGSDVELGDFGRIRTDPTVVLRVTPPGLPEDPPEQATLRMRGTSFDRYDGHHWSRTPDLRSGVGRVDDFYAVPVRLPRPGADRRYAVILDHLDEPVIFLPTGTVGLEIPPRVTGGVEVGRELMRAPGTDVRYGDADGLGLRYFAWVSRDPRDFVTELGPERARLYLQVPAGHERVAALARRWTAGAANDAERIRRVLGHLRGGEFEYSLQTPALHGRLPLEVFLFEARRGHCEYYSTAAAILLRTLGIPARNVTGFLGGRWNAFGRYYSLRQGDAHSWVEAWLPGRGWVTLEPTPPSRDAVGPASGLLLTLREMIDALRTRWSEDVVGYDLRSQRGIAEGVGAWVRGLTGEAAVGEGGARDDARGLRPTPGLLAAFALLVVLALLGRWAWRRRSRREDGVPDAPEEVRRAVRLYRALEASLRAVGRPRPPPTTPLEHAAALERDAFEGAGVVREVTERYVEARFSGTGLSAAELARLTERVAAMERAARRSP